MKFVNFALPSLSITIVSHGDLVDRRSIISQLDRRKIASNVDDSGTEADTAGSAIESDTSQAISDIDDDLQESDQLGSPGCRSAIGIATQSEACRDIRRVPRAAALGRPCSS